MSEIVYHSCDFCGNPTRNERPEGDELLCQSCRHDQARRLYRPTALGAARKVAGERLPATLHPRLVKAHELALSGHVTQNGTGWVVVSQTGNGAYRVNSHGCNCPDACRRAPVIQGKPACKHQLAVWLTIKADDLTPIDFEGVYRGTKGQRRWQTPAQSDNYWQWCERCGDSTKHGFGLGCMTCLERREAVA